MADELASSIAVAVEREGLPVQYLQSFLSAFLYNDEQGLSAIPEVTPAILSVAGHVYKVVAARSFRYVWIAAIVVGVITCICKCSLLKQLFDSVPHFPIQTLGDVLILLIHALLTHVVHSLLFPCPRSRQDGFSC